MPLFLFLLFYLCFVIPFSHGPLIPLYYYPTPHFYSELVIQLSHPLCHQFLLVGVSLLSSYISRALSWPL